MKQPELPRYDYHPKPYLGPSFEEVSSIRNQYLSPSFLTYYQKPVMIVEGSMQYLFDQNGRRYLDAIGGIVTISVGHCHPYVVEKIREQIETLQHTSPIYLHPTIGAYAQKLVKTLPGDLNVCYFVNSGSEANDLALLMARLYSGNFDVIALRNGYHGGIASTMGLTAHSSWKYNYPHSFGVHHAIAPDSYRGIWGYDDPTAGSRYAEDIRSLIDYATAGKVAAFFAESIQGVGGAIVYPDGYLEKAFEYVRQAGGICISDEVQSGFGRTGTNYWDFENQGVVPDIVTMAKGIGNGIPLAAVVTTPAIAEKLTQRIHFNTFGGNPVSCAAGKAVLEVIENENLQLNCLEIGRVILDGLNQLKSRYEIIGDVRGRGLMLGVELVKDRRSKTPATKECIKVFEIAKDYGLLLGKGGFFGNVLRIKPPMCLNQKDAEFILDVLACALNNL